MIDHIQEYASAKIALNYHNIVLKHGKGVLPSRAMAVTATEIAGKWVKSPVFCSNMVSVLNYDIVKIFDAKGWFHIWHRIGDYEKIIDYVCWANTTKLSFVSISIGIKEKDIELLDALYQMKVSLGLRVDSICIDVAFSYNDAVLPVIEKVKTLFPESFLIVGNGDSPEWIQWLESYGVDAAKINIGVSKACRTRQFTGFGSSTVTDLYLCAEAAKKIKIISDGGLTTTDAEVDYGDIAKAIRFGADYVMSGTIFKNCIDSPALKNGYYGNASRTAKGNQHVEGTNLSVETNCLTTREVMDLIEESLKSSVSYGGGKQLYDLRKVDYRIVL